MIEAAKPFVGCVKGRITFKPEWKLGTHCTVLWFESNFDRCDKVTAAVHNRVTVLKSTVFRYVTYNFQSTLCMIGFQGEIQKFWWGSKFLKEN